MHFSYRNDNYQNHLFVMKHEIEYLVQVKDFENTLEKWRLKDKVYMAGAQHDNYLISWDGYQPVAKVIRNVFSVEEKYSSNKVDL